MAPSQVIQAVEESLPAALGDNLLSLVVHGIHARVDVDKPGPVHLLIVVRDLKQEVLQRLADALHERRVSHAIVTILLSLDELNESTDVFPITFMEMQRRYRVLAGNDVLRDLVISDVHLRLRCEQELKNLAIRMQSLFLRHSRKARQLIGSLKLHYSAFVRAVRASLVLVGQRAPEDDAEILALAADQFGIDIGVLTRVDEATGSGGPPSSDFVADVYQAFLVEVHRMAGAIDRLPDDVTVLETSGD